MSEWSRAKFEEAVHRAHQHNLAEAWKISRGDPNNLLEQVSPWIKEAIRQGIKPSQLTTERADKLMQMGGTDHNDPTI